MRKLRKADALSRKLTGPSVADEPAMHFRLCHFCLYLNESSKEVVKCERCGHYLALAGTVVRVADRAEEGALPPRRLGGGFLEDSGGRRRRAPRPLTGLEVLW